MTQDKGKGPAAAAVDVFDAKGPLDLLDAAEYCAREAAMTRGVQMGLVRDGFLKEPDAAAVRRAIRYQRMAAFFQAADPIRDDIRTLMRASLARRRAEEEEIDARIARNREERLRRGDNPPSASQPADEIVPADDGPDEPQSEPVAAAEPPPAPEPAPPTPNRSRRRRA